MSDVFFMLYLRRMCDKMNLNNYLGGIALTEIKKLAEMVEKSRSIVFFGGAGVSTESGISDYRSVNGLYYQKFKYPPEVMLSHSFFVSHTEEFFDFYRAKMICPDAKPNAAHIRIAQLEAEGRLSAVVTQNIDGLHQEAGSKNVLELHGSVHRNSCTKCKKAFDARFILQSEGVPKCECGGVVKPDVVLYEEPLNDDTVMRAVNAIAEADMLIIGGTSLAVYPAAGMVNYYKGSRLVVINRSQTPMDKNADLVINDSIGAVLSQI